MYRTRKETIKKCLWKCALELNEFECWAQKDVGLDPRRSILIDYSVPGKHVSHPEI